MQGKISKIEVQTNLALYKLFLKLNDQYSGTALNLCYGHKLSFGNWERDEISPFFHSCDWLHDIISMVSLFKSLIQPSLNWSDLFYAESNVYNFRNTKIVSIKKKQLNQRTVERIWVKKLVMLRLMQKS